MKLSCTIVSIVSYYPVGQMWVKNSAYLLITDDYPPRLPFMHPGITMVKSVAGGAEMEQIERITYMEQILDEATEAVSSLSEALEKYSAVQDKLQELIVYYSSEQWRQDFDDDSAGKIPSNLKRGVLSEDAVYNLLADITDLNDQIQHFKTSPTQSFPVTKGGLDMNSQAEFDLFRIMDILRKKRPLFHSEADFQFALAWEIQTQYPGAAIRLEYCPQAIPDMHIDILVDLNHKVYPIELKYKTLKLQALVDDEFYALKSHGAQDIGKYDCLLDIQRVETYGPKIKNFACGYTIWLTNDPSYWKAPKHSGTMAEAFTIHTGVRKHGSMAWAPHTGLGTLKGRESPIVLQSSYTVEWIDYSSISSERSGSLRYALLQIK